VEQLGLDRCRVVAGDTYGAVRASEYDLIVSNPPFHRGKAIDFSVADRLINEAPLYLAEHGTLLVVANAFLAYGKRIAERFGEVEAIAATRQYHVIRARHPKRQ
jgi:16S rRNA (guanine1207-N2)-methyltransferase